MLHRRICKGMLASARLLQLAYASWPLAHPLAHSLACPARMISLSFCLTFPFLLFFHSLLDTFLFAFYACSSHYSLSTEVRAALPHSATPLASSHSLFAPFHGFHYCTYLFLSPARAFPFMPVPGRLCPFPHSPCSEWLENT